MKKAIIITALACVAFLGNDSHAAITPVYCPSESSCPSGQKLQCWIDHDCPKHPCHCVDAPDPCADCVSDPAWVRVDNYMWAIKRECVGACRESTVYTCVSGDYGAPTAATLGRACKKCPNGGTSRAKGAPGSLVFPFGPTNESIKGCYIEPGSGKDASGTYELTSKCYYSN